MIFSDILKLTNCESPVNFIFRRQFGFDTDLILTKCNNSEANDVLKVKYDLEQQSNEINSMVQEKINDSKMELNLLVNQYCDEDEKIKFLSQKLIDNVEICLKRNFNDERREIIRELVTNICAAIYNK